MPATVTVTEFLAGSRRTLSLLRYRLTNERLRVCRSRSWMIGFGGKVSYFLPFLVSAGASTIFGFQKSGSALVNSSGT